MNICQNEYTSKKYEEISSVEDRKRVCQTKKWTVSKHFSCSANVAKEYSISIVRRFQALDCLTYFAFLENSFKVINKSYILLTQNFPQLVAKTCCCFIR